MDKYTINQIVAQYLQTAEWADMDNDPEFNEASYSESFLARAYKDCQEFFDKADENDWLHDLDWSDIGHNFWLSRNRHGAGFFDQPFEFADELQELAKSFGECHVYVGDDGDIYC